MLSVLVRDCDSLQNISPELGETETDWCPWTINEPQMRNASQRNKRPYMTLNLALQKKTKTTTLQPQLVGDNARK